MLLIFFLFPHAVFTALHMSLTAKELLANRHEIHFVSTQLGTSVIQHLLLNVSSVFSSCTSTQSLKSVTVSLWAPSQYLEAELDNCHYVYYYYTKLSVACE